MSIKIIADTNALVGRNSFESLFGNRSELERILRIAGTELIVPVIVIDELLHQKTAAFKTAKSRLIENSYYKRRVPENIKADIEADSIDIDTVMADTSIAYTTIDLTDKSTALDRMRHLATTYQAPFQVYSSDSKENSDKGFKDAYIALTIDEYLGQIDEGENVFLFTKDGRLAEYFHNNSRVVRVRNFTEIDNQIDHPPKPERQAVDAAETGTVRPLSQERLSIQALLNDFRNSSTFAATHVFVADVAALASQNKLTDSDYVDILESTAENNQINWLLGDSDVRDVILPIFKEYGNRLSVEQYNIVAPGLGLETKKVHPYDEMESALESWIELQSEIARGR